VRFDAEESRLPRATLRGEADEASVVRLYADRACAGPVYREVSGEALRAGVEVELLPNRPSPFTARAWNLEGQRSDCSNAASITWSPRPPPPVPTLRVDHVFTSRGVVQLSGVAPLADRVLVTESCGGRAIAELTPDQFAVGITLALDFLGTTYLFATSVTEVEGRSACSAGVAVTWDRSPPDHGVLRLLSPNPSPEDSFRVAWSGSFEVVRVDLFSGAKCSGWLEGSCRGTARECDFIFWAPRPGENHVSARTWDGAGNTTCDELEEVVTWDPSAPRVRPVFTVEPSGEVRLRVPVSVSVLEVFSEPDCRGTATLTDAWAYLGSYFEPRGQSVRAYGDRGPEACASSP